MMIILGLDYIYCIFILYSLLLTLSSFVGVSGQYYVFLCWEAKETPYVKEVYGKTDGEDNAYKQMYTRAQSEVAYIDVD